MGGLQQGWADFQCTLATVQAEQVAHTRRVVSSWKQINVILILILPISNILALCWSPAQEALSHYKTHWTSFYIRMK
jgi:hypothetical protein